MNRKTPLTPISQKFLLLIALLGLFSACSETLSDSGENVARQAVLVANEGNFSEGNGSLSWFDPAEETVLQNRFEQANQRPIGGIIQSVTRSDSHLYIVTNSPNKIEKVTLPELTLVQTLTTDEPAITPVRMVLIDENQGYISSLYDHAVYRVDPSDMTLDPNPIATGNNPQELQFSGTHLFVANNGFGNDETLTVIDTGTDQVVETLQVGAGPLEMEMDSSERLWVLSAGRVAYDENWNRVPEEDLPGRIDVLDPESLETLRTVELDAQATAFTLDERTGYAWILEGENVRRVGIDSGVPEATKLPSREFQTIGVNPWESELYLGESRGYDQRGQVLIASPEGALIDSFQAGIVPTQIEFLELE